MRRNHKNTLGLTHIDLKIATHWTKQFIRSNHPSWSDQEIETFYEKLASVKIVAIDEWSRKFLDDVNAIF